MADHETLTKIVDYWQNAWNPLRNLTQNGIQNLIDTSKNGNDMLLQVCYKEVERCTPIFGIVINKRLSGIINRKWKITANDESDAAIKQAEFVQKLFDECDNLNEDGFTAAIKHLALYSFRGRSYVKPFIVNDKLIFKKLENWNVLRYQNKNYWNPTCDYGFMVGDNFDKLLEIPKTEVCYCLDDRPIDLPGLATYLRMMVGETQWSRFVEKEGVPQVIIKAPAGISDSLLNIWQYRAQAIFEGGSGVLPNDAAIEQLTAARGQDPFSEFLKHQTETIVLLATGNTLGTLPGSSGLGSNVAEIQNDQFNQLITADCKQIQNTINACVLPKIMKHFGLGEQLCKFEYVQDENVSVKETLEAAKIVKDLGGKINFEELKKLTKLQFIEIDETWQPDTKKESKEWTVEEKEELKQEIT